MPPSPTRRSATDATELLPGTLTLMVLQVLGQQDLHGYGIARRIESLSRDVLAVEQGSLYPALYRLERAGLIRARRSTSDTGRRVKVYALTNAGRRQLERERSRWKDFVTAVGRVVKGTS
jgi:PadR family transcriptional regulator